MFSYNLGKQESKGGSPVVKALVFRGPGKKEWTDKPRPTIQKPTDAIVRITHTTICGTDLHFGGSRAGGDGGAHPRA